MPQLQNNDDAGPSDPEREEELAGSLVAQAEEAPNPRPEPEAEETQERPGDKNDGHRTEKLDHPDGSDSE